jgi:hypothetical protein
MTTLLVPGKAEWGGGGGWSCVGRYGGPLELKDTCVKIGYSEGTGTGDSRLNPEAWEEFGVGEDGFLNSNIELGFEAEAEEETSSMLGMEAVAEEAMCGLVKSKWNVNGFLNSRIAGFLNSMFGLEDMAEEAMTDLVKLKSNVDGFLNSTITGFLISMFGVEAVTEEATSSLVKSKSNLVGFLNSRITGFLNSMFGVEAVAKELTSSLMKSKSHVADGFLNSNMLGPEAVAKEGTSRLANEARKDAGFLNWKIAQSEVKLAGSTGL